MKFETGGMLQWKPVDVRVMRAGGNEAPPDFDLTTSHMHKCMQCSEVQRSRLHTYTHIYTETLAPQAFFFPL